MAARRSTTWYSHLSFESNIATKALTAIQLWLVFTKLPTPQSKQAAAGSQLRKEVVRLNREMTNTSAQDDFAKWAKLRRQHDKKKDEYEKNGTKAHLAELTIGHVT